MRREILIDGDDGEIRIVLLEDDQLCEAYFERPGARRLTGDIYKGRVNNVLPGIQSAFVDIGLKRHAFLYVEDLQHPTEALQEGAALAPPGEAHSGARSSRGSIEESLAVGSDQIVQVVREPVAQKGARITMQTALAGRSLVYLPGVQHVGVSRRIEDDEERERLRSTLTTILVELGIRGGCIVRTAGEGQTADEFRGDIRALASQWEGILRKAADHPAPALLHREPGSVERVLRDIFRADIDRVIVDGAALHRDTVETMRRMQQDLVDRIHRHDGSSPLFRERGVQRQLDRALGPRVWLKSGGSIVINQTEALVAIDVNTGKYVGRHRPEETILRTNLEAVEAIVRQVRLRDLAGIIVIDFVDMEETESRDQLLTELHRELRRDRARCRVLQISDFGLVEITRQRTKPSLERMLSRPCPSCSGSGRVKSPETIYFEVLREARQVLAAASATSLCVRAHGRTVPPLVEERARLARALGLAGEDRVRIEIDDELGGERFEVSPG
ncbi:MAG: Rne/Rng family ribonuclease [Acidobacteria bacterium]|nr:Rne/Rng family ribonuclease [Acidobacteriota bacterium]